MRRIASVLLLCLGLAWSQDFRATITGQITDPSKAPLPNANVKAVKDGTSETKETRTNNDGIYTLPYLDPGSYTVEISASGFNTVRRAIVLRVAERQNLTLVMDVGQ